ncbi:Tat binding protein 1-interacting protein-domain-containing protein [Aspergillus pseudoustus]|uniref:Tat binding protein 1-interacting protein-domain-containing protein n=1 Tax=Aspergillus pseudoustus TaxID=1810923 RepID=A0ABR4J9F2_9EURO
MAPKKGKNDKQGGDHASSDGTAMILDYLRKQNRPYSAIDISANLHNKVTKTYAVKALRELHQKNEIECRVAGKQTVYHATQEEPDEISANAVAAMGEEIQTLQEQLPGLKEDEKKIQAELSSLNAVPLLSELRAEIQKLEEEKEFLSAKLADVHGDSEVNVSPLEMEAARKDWKYWQGQARVRARICRDVWHKCTEMLPEGTSREELWERLGLEGSPL